jgi:4-hydroxythreonine-4-phosphate dehydrogenase
VIARPPPLAVTQGDPAGIGPELALKAWLARREAELPPFFILADPEQLRDVAARFGLPCPLVAVSPEEADSTFDEALPVVPLPMRVSAEPGRPDPATASATLAAIEQAVALTRAGRASAIVTNPIAKHVLYAAGFTHPGHTEYLAALAAAPGESPTQAVMLLWSEALAIVPVTIHIPLREVPAALTEDLIVDTARIVASDYASRFGIARPRVALAGLNPHAGEAGTIGTEDRDIVAPAVARLRQDGLDVSGPWPADTMFHARARAGYDVAIAMYHDQALIPIKTLAFDDGVNCTLGLPFIRTSPDHGTAFDIAARGIARPDSLIAAIRLAGRLAATAAA